MRTSRPLNGFGQRSPTFCRMGGGRRSGESLTIRAGATTARLCNSGICDKKLAASSEPGPSCSASTFCACADHFSKGTSSVYCML